jgi:hypothetical protein
MSRLAKAPRTTGSKIRATSARARSETSFAEIAVIIVAGPVLSPFNYGRTWKVTMYEVAAAEPAVTSTGGSPRAFESQRGPAHVVRVSWPPIVEPKRLPTLRFELDLVRPIRARELASSSRHRARYTHCVRPRLAVHDGAGATRGFGDHQVSVAIRRRSRLSAQVLLRARQNQHRHEVKGLWSCEAHDWAITYRVQFTRAA